MGSQPWCLPVVAANTAMVGGVVMPLVPQTPGLCNASFNGQKLASPPGGLVATWDPSQWQALAHQNNRYWNVNAELNWDLGFANLTVIPSYRRVDNDYSTFPVAVFEDGGPGLPEISESESFEARLAKDTSLVNWVAGLYYFHEKQDVQALQYGGFLFNTFNPDFLGTTSYAVFGQGTWHVSDQFRLITGLRYSQDHKTNTGQAIAIFPSIFEVAGQPCFNAPASGCVQNAFSGSLDSHAVNWKAGAEYDLTPVNMLFATVSTGYKAGGLNSEAINYPVDQTPVPYKPETVTAFELGSRNQFLDRRLQVNLEGFYWLYKNHQENASFANPAGGFVPATVNAGAATLYGADLSVVAIVTPEDTLNFSTEYNHSQYTNFLFVSSGLIQGIDTNCQVTPVPGSATSQNINCKGFPLAQAPLWSGSISWTHTALTLPTAATSRLQSAVCSPTSATSRMSSQRPGADAGLLFAQTSMRPITRSGGKWSLGVFGRNVTDAVTYSGSFNIRGLNHSIQAVNVGAPVTHGVRLGTISKPAEVAPPGATSAGS